MPFIGIIAKESDSNFIKNEILKNSSHKFEIININRESIQNLKNIKFETIIISEDTENLLEISKYLEEIIKNVKYLIINSDEIKNITNLSNINLITYGLNHEACVTVSSIKSENVLICIQKKIEKSDGSFLEEQEINVEMSKNSQRKIYNLMAIFTILGIYDEILKKI